MAARILVWTALAMTAASATATAQTPEAANKVVLAAFMEAQNERDWDRLDALVAADMVRHSQATPGAEVVRDLASFKALLQEWTVQFPDWRMECPRIVAEGDFVGAWCVFSGTQVEAMGPFPPTGKRTATDVAGVFRFADGKIAEWWVTWDNLALLTELGHFPPPGAP